MDDLYATMYDIQYVVRNEFNFTKRTAKRYLKRLKTTHLPCVIPYEMSSQIRILKHFVGVMMDIDASHHPLITEVRRDQRFAMTSLLKAIVFTKMFLFLVNLTRTQHNLFLDETQNVQNLINTLLCKGGEYRNAVHDLLHDRELLQRIHIVRHLYVSILGDLSFILDHAYHLFQTLWSDSYRQSIATKRLNLFRKELIERTWHPSRLCWCLDYEEQRDIFSL
jgi:hypothetical protein